MHPFMREMTGQSVVADMCNVLNRLGRPVPCGSPGGLKAADLSRGER